MSEPAVGGESVRDLAPRLRLAGREITVPGNRPLPLEPAGAVWYILDGALELFAVGESGRGPRTHLSTRGPGRLLFGVDGDPDRHGVRLVGVGVSESRLVRLDVQDLRELAREPGGTRTLGEMIGTWIDGLFERIRSDPPPKIFTEIQPGTEVDLDEAGTAARTASGLSWVRPLAGRCLFLGRPSLAVEPGDFLLPVSDATWLVAGDPVTLSAVGTEALVRSGRVWDELPRFHGLFLDYVDLELDRARDEEETRFARRAERDRWILESAQRRLASVLESSAEARALETVESPEPLLETVRLVAEADGIELRAAPRTDPSAPISPEERLRRICIASRVRHRRVILRDDWWRRDNGPLLAFRASEEGRDRRPVALLPTSSSSYDAVDTLDGRRLPVDREYAETLEGQGFMLYRPLPEGPVGKLDLLLFALRGCRKDLSTLLLMGLGAGLLSLLVPIVTGQIFGRVIPSSSREQLLQLTLALVVGALGAALFQITRGIAVLRLGGKLDGSLQPAVWDRLLQMPASFFRRFTVGDLVQRSMGIDAIRGALTGNVTTSLLAAVFSVFSFAILFYYSWPLALLATALVAGLLLATGTLAWLQLRHQRRVLELRGRISSLLFGLINGIAKLRVAGAERRAFSLWADRFGEQRELTVRAQRIANVQAVVNVCYPLASSLAIFGMAAVSLRADIGLSDFLAFNAAFGQFQAAALSSIGLVSTLLTLVPTYERLEPVLETPPEVDSSKAEAGELEGDIELSHVFFRYDDDGPLILDDVSFRASPGEMIALVGPSGSGKSTCLRLLLGFEQPASGSIYFDGQDLPSLDLDSVRRQIGVVLQGGRPMVGNIYSNIVGSSNLGLDAAWEAARMAGLAEDIEAMPMGMHTVISEGAGTFSGGQRQRLLIARAVVHRPRILLFDEATSALDNRTQETVSRSIERLKATRIIVAHRLSTILGADRIYVLDRGRVAEQGTYEELLAAGGVFTRLAERQMVEPR